MPPSRIATISQPPKLFDRVRRCIHDRHYSLRTEDAYVYWIRGYIRRHKLKGPLGMRAAEVNAFLFHLTTERQGRLSTHKQALCLPVIAGGLGGEREVLNVGAVIVAAHGKHLAWVAAPRSSASSLFVCAVEEASLF